ncbi:MAG TPA: DUF4249 domain-containing protein [Bacteroidales bacterium]|nr:DUF4249 domain-containing protein [Bacteroidales bacterium]
MKRVVIYFSVVAILILLASSCEEIIEFKGEKIEPKLVLYSMLNPDSVITASVSKSHAVFDIKYEPQQITDAVVRLYRDGEFVETLTYTAPPPSCEYCPPVSQSKYVSQGTKPVPGSTYRIEAEVPGLKSVSGETSLPDMVPVLSIDTVTEKEGEYNTYLVTKVKFADPGVTENYYMLSVTRLEGYYNGDPSVPFYPEASVSVYKSDESYAAREDPLISPSQEEDLFGMYIENTYNVFSDELISGKEYDILLKMYIHKQPDTDHFEFSHFRIELHSISRELYLYLRSYSAHLQTRDAFFAEPVLVYSNIENGLGVVGARVPSVATIEIGSYPVEGVTYDFGF